MSDKPFKLRMQCTPLQFTDTSTQQESDIRAIFERSSNFPIKMGTEAGPGPGGMRNRDLLTEYAKEYDHVINFGGDAWIAVDQSIMVRNSVSKEDVFLADNDELATKGADRVMPTISFDHKTPGVGRIHAASVHYPTKGATKGSPNWNVNAKMAKGISDWMVRVASSSDLAFVGGDFNMPDRNTDWSFGRKFTSMADELKAWANTGHGPIDGFCSFNGDRRVSAHKFTVLNDKQFKLHTDHYVCRGVWNIQLTKAPTAKEAT